MDRADLPEPEVLDWIGRGAHGDEDACAALYRQFSPAVLRLALGLLGDLDDAEEVAQDAFVYAFRNLRSYDPARSAFATWLYTITLSRCRNKRRRKWLMVLPLDRLGLERHAAAERQVEAVVERRGIRRQVWQALQALPPRLREPVALRYLGEMRYKAIGQALGCNPKTAESRVRLGLQLMRRRLEAQGAAAPAEVVEQWGW
jgi:RNA polymerase sigma-70 factor (ECF subfamily)